MDKVRYQVPVIVCRSFPYIEKLCQNHNNQFKPTNSSYPILPVWSYQRRIHYPLWNSHQPINLIRIWVFSELAFCLSRSFTFFRYQLKCVHEHNQWWYSNHVPRKTHFHWWIWIWRLFRLFCWTVSNYCQAVYQNVKHNLIQDYIGDQQCFLVFCVFTSNLIVCIFFNLIRFA